MSNSASNRHPLSEYLVYALVFVCAILLIFFGVELHDHYEGLSSFLKELGYAGVISIIVIFTVEKFSRERHLEASHQLVELINRNLFAAIYHRHLPDVLFSEVESTLLNIDVYRTEYQISYSLQSALAPDLHEALVQSSYRLHNIASTPLTHDIRQILERPLNRAYLQHCRMLAVAIAGNSLSEREIQSHTSYTGTHVVFVWPVTIPAHASIDVTTMATLVKRDTDVEIWTSRIPSDGLKLTLTVPSTAFEFDAYALHSQLLNPTGTHSTSRSWDLRRPLLPHQGVVMWWHNTRYEGAQRVVSLTAASD